MSLAQRAIAGVQRRLRPYANGRFRRAALEVASDAEHLRQSVRQHVEPVDAPLLLISQAPRSGGTLLGQLFDGHPEILSHPAQLHNVKRAWPTFEAAAGAAAWFDQLFEQRTVEKAREGYRRGRNDEAHPFLFFAAAQRDVFLDLLADQRAPTDRAIFDAYMGSYFAAWLNHRAMPGPKRFVSAFVSQMATEARNVEGLFRVYPDGYLLQILRPPESWYASMLRVHQSQEGRKFSDEERVANVGEVTDFWSRSAEAVERNRKAFGERVIVLDFETLVADTEATMRGICSVTGLPYDEALTLPTFNGVPLLSNTSFEPVKGEVDRRVLDRRHELLEEEVAYLRGAPTELYERVRDLALAPTRLAAQEEPVVPSKGAAGDG